MKGIDKPSQNNWPAEDIKESASEYKTVESVQIKPSQPAPAKTQDQATVNPWPGVFNVLAIAILGAAIIYALFWFYKKNKK